MAFFNHLLGEMFRAHGYESVTDANWLVFPHYGMAAKAEVAREARHGSLTLVQLELRLFIDDQHMIFESFVGTGQSRDDAVRDALGTFTAGVLHVWLSAFFLPDNEQTQLEDWQVEGRTLHATIGQFVCRGQVDVDPGALAAAMQLLSARLQGAPLDAGPHWVRLFVAQSQGELSACEVLLDNVTWPAVQQEAAELPWPRHDAYYSARLFFVVDVELA